MTPINTFPMTITVYDFDNVLLKSYPNVPIPMNPAWKTDIECVNYLQKFCPALQFNVVYGITPYVDVEPLCPFEGAIYPTISPTFRNCVGWDLKQTNKWVDMSSNRRMEFGTNRVIDVNTNRVLDINTNRFHDVNSNRLVDTNTHRLLHMNTNLRLDKLEAALDELKAELVKSKMREVVIKSNM